MKWHLSLARMLICGGAIARPPPPAAVRIWHDQSSVIESLGLVLLVLLQNDRHSNIPVFCGLYERFFLYGSPFILFLK